jgi:hypothetical protein
VRILALVGVATGCLCTPPPLRDTPDAAPDAADATTDPCPDVDGDGWRAGGPACGTYLDCADDNPARHPGALEDVGGDDLDCNDTSP